jgi:DNA methylase
MSEIRPQARNANRHTQRGMQALETSIATDGWIGAITVAADGETFDGSARVEKTAENGMLDEAIVVDSDGTRPIVVRRTDIPTATDPRAVRLGVAANRVAALNLEWEPDILAGIADSGVDLGALFTADEWADVTLPALPEAGAGGDDFDPQVLPRRVEYGELWRLGEHVLLCGDSTKFEDVARLMQGACAELTASDPPYNVDIEYGDGTDDSKSADAYETFSRAWFGVWQEVSERQIVTPGCNNLASWCRWFDPYHVAPWTKTNAMTNGKVSRWWCWEPMLFFGAKWSRERTNDVFDHAVPPQTAKGIGSLSGLHPCPKPLAMWIDLYENYSEHGAIVADAFGGSGTAVIAAERTGRKARVCEIEPKYADLIVARWEAETGLTAERI